MGDFGELRFGDHELPVGANSEVASSSADSAAAAQARGSEYLHHCPLCSTRFVNKYSLSRHLKSHHVDDKNFDCRICSKLYTTHAAFMRHLKKHPGAKPYACDLCDRAYITSSDLAKHRAAKHSAGRGPLRQPASHTCAYCDRAFRVAANLAAHECLHTGRRPHSCRHCPYRSASLANLRSHELCRHGGGRRPFACDRCGRAFASRCGLLKHRDTHADLARHACRLCGRRYRHRPTLSRHLRLAHSAAPVLDESMLDLHDLNLNIGPEAAQRIAGEILSCIQDDSSLPPPGGIAFAAAAASGSGSGRI